MVNPAWLIESQKEWGEKYRPAKLRFLDYWKQKHDGGRIRAVQRNIEMTDAFYEARFRG